MGDLHAENLGMCLDSRRRLVWGINDFDEACELPFTSDLVRLAASIVFAAEARRIEALLPEIGSAGLSGDILTSRNVKAVGTTALAPSPSAA